MKWYTRKECIFRWYQQQKKEEHILVRATTKSHYDRSLQIADNFLPTSVRRYLKLWENSRHLNFFSMVRSFETSFRLEQVWSTIGHFCCTFEILYTRERLLCNRLSLTLPYMVCLFLFLVSVFLLVIRLHMSHFFVWLLA